MFVDDRTLPRYADFAKMTNLKSTTDVIHFQKMDHVW